jgi:methionine-rich copper-binding protein CopC
MSVSTAPRRRTGLTARLLLVLLGSAVTLVVAAGPASAHDALSGSSPADGSAVATVPATVVLTFDEPAIAMGTRVVVRGPAGEVQQGNPVLVDDTVSQSLQGGAPAGPYTVEWRVTSADGHPVSGSFTFTARAAGEGQPGATSTASPVALPISKPAPEFWPWVVAVAILSFVVVGAVALGRRATRAPE